MSLNNSDSSSSPGYTADPSMSVSTKRGGTRPASIVWTCFERTNKNQVICNLCKTKFRFCNSTSTLIRHLLTKHKKEFDKKKEEENAKNLLRMLQVENQDAGSDRPSTSTSSPSSSTPVFITPWNKPEEKEKSLKRKSHHQQQQQQQQQDSNADYRKRMLDYLIVDMICSDLQPVSIVEDEGFRRLLHALDPGCLLPSKEDITGRLLPNLYHEHKARVLNELCNAPSVSVATEMWTSHKTELFLTTTAQFIDRDWNLQSFVLSSGRLTKNHTADNIVDELKRVLHVWNIRDKVDCIVSDASPHMTLACNTLNIEHVPCFAHLLNNIVHKSIKNTKEINALKQRVKNIGTFFHHNPGASDTFRDLQTREGKTPLNLKQENVQLLDWRSTLRMFVRYLEVHESVTGTLSKIGQYDLVLDVSSNDVIRKCVAVLDLFEMAMNEILRDKFTSLSTVIPIVKNLLTLLTSTKHLAPCQLAEELDLQMRVRFQILQNNFFPAVSTLLDPRFKNLFMADQTACTEVKDRLVNTLFTTDVDNRSSAGQTRSSAGDITEGGREDASATEESFAMEEKSIFWSSFDRSVEEAILAQANRHPTSGPSVELRKYDEEALIKRREDPRVWWKDRQAVFPLLHGVAKKFLGVPATSCVSSSLSSSSSSSSSSSPPRLFSKTEQVTSDSDSRSQRQNRRYSLKDSLVDKILFLNKNNV